MATLYILKICGHLQKYSESCKFCLQCISPAAKKCSLTYIWKWRTHVFAYLAYVSETYHWARNITKSFMVIEEKALLIVILTRFFLGATGVYYDTCIESKFDWMKILWGVGFMGKKNCQWFWRCRDNFQQQSCIYFFTIEI